MGKVKTISKSIILLMLIGIMVISSVCLIMPKYYVQTTEWIATSTAKGFYDLGQNSADVVFLGSSHSFTSFSTQELYNKYNITSYNLGSGLQSPIVSYYWLKEMERYQTPKVVVLELIAFFIGNGTPLNASEAWVRNALDPMRWSSVKMEAVDDICRLDPSESKLSYFLPNIRFHERWKELNEDDFSENELRKHNELKGFSPLLLKCGIEDFKPFTVDPEAGVSDFHSIGREYLDKITGFCKDNNIRLILTATPSQDYTIETHNTAQQYSDEHGIEFIDFNAESIYNEINYDFAVDNNDREHPNLSGAHKITDYLGRLLTEEYGLSTHIDEQWENTKSAYEDINNDFALRYENNFTKYLKLINHPRYTVFISANGEWTEALTEKQLQGLRALGLYTDFRDPERESFYAVIKDAKAESERSGSEQIEEYGTLRDGKSHYYIMSAGSGAGNRSSILIDDTEYSLNRKGLNIVVYNTPRRQILDRISFDPFEGNVVLR